MKTHVLLIFTLTAFPIAHAQGVRNEYNNDEKTVVLLHLDDFENSASYGPQAVTLTDDNKASKRTEYNFVSKGFNSSAKRKQETDVFGADAIAIGFTHGETSIKSSTEIPLTGSFTAEIDLKLDAGGVAESFIYYIFLLGDQSSSDFLRIRAADRDSFTVDIRMNGKEFSSPAISLDKALADWFPLDIWTHLAWQYDAETQKTSVFINGTKILEADLDIRPDSNDFFYIATDKDEIGTWPGFIDEFRISNVPRY